MEDCSQGSLVDPPGAQGIEDDNGVNAFLQNSARRRANKAACGKDHGDDAQTHANPDAL